MGTLAVIVTAYGERGTRNVPRAVSAIAASTRQPDELWVMTENVDPTALGWIGLLIADHPTPRNDDGTYAVVPYSLKQNFALDWTTCDYITYATDDSWPDPEKYERMARALDENPEWGAVYCSQDYGSGVRAAVDIEHDAFCRVDHTQVMHRRTADRWPTEIGDITLGDAIFWRRLHESLGPFYPVGPEVLDNVRQTPDGISGGQRS